MELNTYRVYRRRVYGPIGAQQDWLLKFVPIGSIKADSPEAAVSGAQYLYGGAPIVEAEPLTEVAHA